MADSNGFEVAKQITTLLRKIAVAIANGKTVPQGFKTPQ